MKKAAVLSFQLLFFPVTSFLLQYPSTDVQQGYHHRNLHPPHVNHFPGANKLNVQLVHSTQKMKSLNKEMKAKRKKKEKTKVENTNKHFSLCSFFQLSNKSVCTNIKIFF